MIRIFSGVLLGAAMAMAGTVPSMTIFSRSSTGAAVRREFALPRVASISFGESGSTGIVRNAATGMGFRFVGRQGNGYAIQLRGVPGSLAQLRIHNLQGRQLWAGSTQLDASGSAALLATELTGQGVLIGAFVNGGFSQTKVLPMVGGGR